jgi:hypothetical protein
MKKFLGLLVFVSFLFSACAPAIPGSSRYSPIDARDTNGISITAGPEWFAKTSGPAGLVSLKTRNSSLNELIKREDAKKGTIKSTNVNWFKIQDIKAPTGWIIEIAVQTGIREIADADDDGSYTYFDRSELTWLVKAPPATPVGTYPVLISVASRDNPEKSAVVFLAVKVITPVQ